MSKELDNFNLVIFGGDGDLAMRKIFPALYYRLMDDQIKEDSKIVVVSINAHDTASFLELLSENMSKYVPDSDSACMDQLKSMVQYMKADLTQSSDYEALSVFLEKNPAPCTLLYYSTPASLFGTISKLMNEHQAIHANTRVIVEKPLGLDLTSFEALNAEIREYFQENQIYRIDH